MRPILKCFAFIWFKKTTKNFITCTGHPDDQREEGPPSFALLLAEHLAGLMQNYRQSPLYVVEKLDTGPSSFTAFSLQDDNYYLLAFMINTKTHYLYTFIDCIKNDNRRDQGEIGR
jgi:hypothetical protein